MKSLMILRHAAAAAPTQHIDDSARALTGAGKTQAQELGRHLQRTAVPADQVMCSSAVRAQQTANALVDAAEWICPIVLMDDLYNATATEMLAALQAQPSEVSRSLIVAHVPGVADLMSLLITTGDDLALVYKAGTLAELELEIDHWDEARPGVGVLLQFLAPS